MQPRTRARAVFALRVAGVLTVAGAACSTTLTGSLDLVTGPDDGFTQSPVPTRLVVQLINAAGEASVVGNAAIPGDGGLVLPAQPGANVEVVQVTGFDDAGDAVVSGSTIPFALDQVSGATLNIFVQRTGQFSRLPTGDGGTAILVEGGLPPSPILTDLYSRFLLISGGTGKSTGVQVYDSFLWQVQPQPIGFPIEPLSLAFVDTYTGSDASVDGAEDVISAILDIGDDGGATWLDLTDTTGADLDADIVFDASLPSGLTSYAEVAGGQTIVSPSGYTYIVGGTRKTGGATSTILRISQTGTLSTSSLATKRLGATAAIANGSLCVFGGEITPDGGLHDAAGPTGIECIDELTSMNVAPGNQPFDTTTGAGAVAFGDGGSLLLVGGVTAKGTAAPSRFYSSTAAWGSATDAGLTLWPSLPDTLVTAQVFALSNPINDAGQYSAIVVGSDKTGASSAYVMTPTTVTPVPFRVARTNAQAALLANGALVVVGGDSGTLESFIR